MLTKSTKSPVHYTLLDFTVDRVPLNRSIFKDRYKPRFQERAYRTYFGSEAIQLIFTFSFFRGTRGEYYRKSYNKVFLLARDAYRYCEMKILISLFKTIMYVWYFTNRALQLFSNIYNVQFETIKFHEGEEISQSERSRF